MCKILEVTLEPHNSSIAVTQEMLVDAYDQHPGANMQRASVLQKAVLDLGPAQGVLVVLFVTNGTYTVIGGEKKQRA